MALDHSRRIQQLFDAVLARPRDERRAWLEAECGHDAEMHTAVTALLEEQEYFENTVEVPPPLRAEPAAPRTIGRFEVLRRLGMGGMGAVYLARDPAIDRRVAIKVLRDEAPHGQFYERFQREARAAGNLRHPNIVTIFEYGEQDGQPYLVMEYVAGRTLNEVIAERQPLPLTQKLQMLEQLCEGLSCAHKAGLIHRDIKPSNIIVDRDGMIRIVDFGIVKPRVPRPDGGATVVTNNNVIVGTPGYMAPEQVWGLAVDHRCDMFAAAVVAYELLTYDRPFGTDIKDIHRRIVHGEVTPIRSAAPFLPDSVVRAVTRGMALSADQRYGTMAEMGHALKVARQGLDAVPGSEPATEPVEVEPGPAPSTRRGLWLALAGGVAAVAVAAGLLSGPQPPADDAARPVSESAANRAPAASAAPPAPAPEEVPAAAGARAAVSRAADTGRPRESGDMRSAAGTTAPSPRTAEGRLAERPGLPEAPMPTPAPPPMARLDAVAAPVLPPVDRPAPAADTPAPATSAPTPAAEDRAGVTRALVAFEAAFRNASTPALKRVQPSISREQLAVFDRRFLDNVSYIVKVRNERITFDSPTTARVTCLLDEDYTPFAGEPQHVSAPASIDLALDGSSWVVTRVRSQNWR